jgi:hypothetical protein
LAFLEIIQHGGRLLLESDSLVRKKSRHQLRFAECFLVKKAPLFQLGRRPGRDKGLWTQSETSWANLGIHLLGPEDLPQR